MKGGEFGASSLVSGRPCCPFHSAALSRVRPRFLRSHLFPSSSHPREDKTGPRLPRNSRGKKRENRGGKKKRTFPGSPPTSTGVGEAKARLHFLGFPAPERLRSGSEVRGRPPAGALSPAGRVRRAPRDAPAAPPSAAGWNPSQLGRKAVVCFLVERST